MRTEAVCKGVVEETSLVWLVHRGDDYTDDQSMFVRENSDCGRLFSLDVLGIEERGNTGSESLNDFTEDIVKKETGRYEVRFHWIPGSKPTDTNEQQSRRGLMNVNRKPEKAPQLKKEYDNIINEQLVKGVVEEAPENPTGYRVYYMPHKPVVRQDVTSTKVRMVFDANAKPNTSAESINDCMFTTPTSQPQLWDILVRTRLMQNLVRADIQKAFFQIEVKEEDRILSGSSTT